MQMKIKAVFNVIPLLVRYSQDESSYESMVFFNVEEGKLIHNIEIPSEFKFSFENKIIEMFGPLKPDTESLPQFDDYVTSDLQGQINSARRGDASAFDERIAGMKNFTNEEEN
jgi:hypothetical protein